MDVHVSASAVHEDEDEDDDRGEEGEGEEDATAGHADRCLTNGSGFFSVGISRARSKGSSRAGDVPLRMVT